MAKVIRTHPRCPVSATELGGKGRVGTGQGIQSTASLTPTYQPPLHRIPASVRHHSGFSTLFTGNLGGNIGTQHSVLGLAYFCHLWELFSVVDTMTPLDAVFAVR